MRDNAVDVRVEEELRYHLLDYFQRQHRLLNPVESPNQEFVESKIPCFIQTELSRRILVREVNLINLN